MVCPFRKLDVAHRVIKASCSSSCVSITVYTPITAIFSVFWTIFKAQYLKWSGCQCSSAFMKFPACRDVNKSEIQFEYIHGTQKWKSRRKATKYSLSGNVDYSCGRCVGWLPSPSLWTFTASRPFPIHSSHAHLLSVPPQNAPVHSA